jgi:hypothetical protein
VRDVRFETCLAVLAAAAISLFFPPLLSAQTAQKTPVSQILPNLFGNTIVVTPAGTPEFPNHSAHFKPGVDQLETPQQFNQQIVTLLATFPTGSSSGGFTYTFNPALGTFSRSSESFGPLFAERALTIGRDRGSLGVGYQRSTYDTFEGKNLRQPEIVFHIEHIDCCGRVAGGAPAFDGSRLNPAFEGDIIEAALRLDLTTDTLVFFATYGLTDRLDLGVAVPVVRTDVEASIRARIERLSTAANPELHAFDGENPDERTFVAAGSATGLGDIVLRAKYNFLRRRGGGLAGAIDVRTPTGGGPRQVLAACQRGLYRLDARRPARRVVEGRVELHRGIRSRRLSPAHRDRGRPRPHDSRRRKAPGSGQDLRVRGSGRRRRHWRRRRGWG